MVLVLALAFRRGAAEEVDVAVLAAEGATDLVATLSEAHHVNVRLVEDVAEAERMLRGGEVEILAVKSGEWQLRLDPDRPESELARLRVVERLREASGQPAPAGVSFEDVRDTGARYVDWVFAGLLGANLISTAVWGVGFAIVDQRRNKLIRRLLVTPMHKSSYLMGLLLSRLWMLVLEVGVVTSFACLLLDVPFRGSFWAFALVSLVGGLSFVGVGILVASRAQTQEGISGLTNAVVLPMWLVSGVFFSYTKFPEAFVPWIRVLPLTSLNDALRKVMLEGHGMVAILPETGYLALWGVASFLLSLKLFRWA